MQQDLFFDHAELTICGEFRLGIICRVRGIANAFGDFDVGHTFFARPFGDRQFEAQHFDAALTQTFCVPEFGMRFFRHMMGNHAVNHLLAHVFNLIENAISMHEVDTLLEDHLALVIDDIVIFQNIFSDVEIARFDLLLRCLDRFVHPGMGDALIFLDAQTFHDRIQALRREDPHQVIIDRDKEF